MNTADEPAQTSKPTRKNSMSYATVYITEELLTATANILASFAEPTSSEGVVYWFGFETPERSIVTTLIVPEAQSTWGCITTTVEANARVLQAIVGTPLILLGQAHSHPRHHVRHSVVDDRDTFAQFDGALSVVVPYYGRRGLKLSRCGIHRHMDGKFQIISYKHIDKHLQVIPGTIDFRKPLDHE